MKILRKLRPFPLSSIRQKFFYIFVFFLLFKLAKTFTLLFKILQKNYFRKSKDLKERYGSGSWVVVTGSSDGLGKGFCTEFASKGFNLVLLSRNYEKNEMLINELKNINPNIETINIGVDFKEANRKNFFELLSNKISELDISILVNNVGKYGFDHFEYHDENEIFEILTINCIAMTLLTRKIVPKMLTRRKKSAIINISSLISMKPCPYIAVFAASKAFVDSFSKGISLEGNINKKIDVLSLKVFQISTNMINKSKGFWILDPLECAQSCLKNLGYETSTFGHWKHELMNWIYNFLPEILRVSFFDNMMKNLEY